MLPSILCSRVCCLDVLQLYTSRHDMLLFCCTARKFGDMHTPQHSLLNNQSHPQQHIPLCPESCSSVRHQDIPDDMHRAYKFAYISCNLLLKVLTSRNILLFAL